MHYIKLLKHVFGSQPFTITFVYGIHIFVIIVRPVYMYLYYKIAGVHKLNVLEFYSIKTYIQVEQ